jgi:hypothetical protein
MWLASVIALAVAAAVFVFALQWKPLIIAALVIAAGIWGYRWLCRRYPTIAIALFSGFLSGLTGGRGGYYRRWWW